MKYAFITGMGRSGTKFLSGLLALDKDVYSVHEFIGNREYWLVSWYLGDVYSSVILQNEKKRIDTKVEKNCFIDVNPAAVNYYGYTYEEFINELKIDEINTLSKKEIKERMKEAKTKKRASFQTPNRRRLQDENICFFG